MDDLVIAICLLAIVIVMASIASQLRRIADVIEDKKR